MNNLYRVLSFQNYIVRILLLKFNIKFDREFLNKNTYKFYFLTHIAMKEEQTWEKKFKKKRENKQHVVH